MGSEMCIRDRGNYACCFVSEIPGEIWSSSKKEAMGLHGLLYILSQSQFWARFGVAKLRRLSHKNWGQPVLSQRPSRGLSRCISVEQTTEKCTSDPNLQWLGSYSVAIVAVTMVAMVATVAMVAMVEKPRR